MCIHIIRDILNWLWLWLWCKKTKESCEPEAVQTKSDLCDSVKQKSKQIYSREGLPVYLVPLQEEKKRIPGSKFYTFGKESGKDQQHRTIMVLGATGSGKSTLINGMINYILGVEWKCPYRFKLVHEDPSKSQAQSQTTEFNVYKINHQEGFKIGYSLTIIDTPGFEDTRGIERDHEITEQLRNLFSSGGVSEIDVVCFVAQASAVRLTPSQKYVFDSVLSIFGNDIKENIRILVTFADCETPPVLEAINKAEVPCPKTKGQPMHFKFNNSALFADNKSSAGDNKGSDDDDDDDDDDDEGKFDEMFWKMGTKSMKRFFNNINQAETKNLSLTKEVLRERKELENSVEKLQLQVKLGLAKLEEIKETSEKVEEFEAEINRNKNFEFEVTVMKPVQVKKTVDYITNCQVCSFTCHDNCDDGNGTDRNKCHVMESNVYYQVCPGKCSCKENFNQKYRWDYVEQKEKRTVDELKKKYDIAKQNKAPVDALLAKLKAEYDAVQDEVKVLVQRSAAALNRLREIALRPNPLSAPEYIDMLIEGEKAEAEPGWKKRVQSLMDMRAKAECLGKVDKGEKLL